MRTNIVLNEKLIHTAMKLTHLKTKKAAVEAGLRLLIQLKQQEEIRKARGKLHWKEDLNTMRTD